MKPGANTIALYTLAGTGTTQWLSASVSYDAIELVTTASLTSNSIGTPVTIAPTVVASPSAVASKAVTQSAAPTALAPVASTAAMPAEAGGIFGETAIGGLEDLVASSDWVLG